MTSSFYRKSINRRWYDKILGLAETVELTQHFPAGIQNSIIRTLTDTIEHYRYLRKTHQYNLGITKVTGLFNAAKRSRWYDKNPKLRRTFNMMVVIPNAPLSQIAKQVITIAKMLNIENQEHLLPNTQKIEQQADSLLKQTYYTFVEDPLGLRVVQNTTTTPKRIVTKTKPTSLIRQTYQSPPN